MKKSMSEYYEFKKQWFAKHGGMIDVETSMIDEYDCYHKTYRANDGSILYENNGPIFLNVDVSYCVDNLIIKTVKHEQIKFFQSELYGSDCSKSEYFIEPWH